MSARPPRMIADLLTPGVTLDAGASIFHGRAQLWACGCGGPPMPYVDGRLAADVLRGLAARAHGRDDADPALVLLADLEACAGTSLEDIIAGMRGVPEAVPFTAPGITAAYGLVQLPIHFCEEGSAVEVGALVARPSTTVNGVRSYARTLYIEELFPRFSGQMVILAALPLPASAL